MLVNSPLGIVHLENSRATAGELAAIRNAFPKIGELDCELSPSLAEDLLAEGATLTISTGDGHEDRIVKKLADLPREPFLVRRVDGTGVKTPLAGLLARLNQPREYEFDRLEGLDLSGCAIAKLDFAPPLEDLQELNVSGTKVADLQPIIGLKHLHKLALDRTPVSSLGLSPS